MKRAKLCIVGLAVVWLLGVFQANMASAQEADEAPGTLDATEMEFGESAGAEPKPEAVEAKVEPEAAEAEPEAPRGNYARLWRALNALQRNVSAIVQTAFLVPRPAPMMPPAVVGVEPEPEVVKAEAEPEVVEAEPEPEVVEAEPEPEVVEAEAEPEAVETEPAVSKANYAGLWQVLNALESNVSAIARTALFAPRPPTTVPPEVLPHLDEVPPPSAPSPAPQEPPKPEGPGVVTLFGRPGGAFVIEKDGTKRAFTPRDLTFRNQPNFHLSDLPLGQSTYGMRKEEPAPGMPAFPEDEAGEAPESEMSPPEVEPEESESGKPAPEDEARPSGESDSNDAEEEQQEKIPTPGEGREGQTEREKAARAAAQEKALEAKNADIEKLKQLRQDGAWFFNPDGSPMTNEQLNARFASGSIEAIKTVDRYQRSWSAKDSYALPEETAPAEQQ